MILERWKKLTGESNYVDGVKAFLSNWGYSTWDEALDGYGASGSTTLDKYRSWLRSQTGLPNTTPTIDLEDYAFTNGLYNFAPTLMLFDGRLGKTLNSGDVQTWTDQVSGIDPTNGTASEQPLNLTKGLNFDYTASQKLSHAHVSSLEFGTADFAIVVVFKTSNDFSVSGAGGILGQGGASTIDGLIVQMGSNNKLQFLTSDGVALAFNESNSTLNDDSLYVAVCQVESTTMKMYIQGVAQTSTATGKNIGSSASSFYLGVRENATPSPIFFYDGDLYHLAIYDNSLKTGEITSLSNTLLEKYS